MLADGFPSQNGEDGGQRGQGVHSVYETKMIDRFATSEHLSACQCPICHPELAGEQNIMLLGGEFVGYYQLNAHTLPEPLPDTSYWIEG